MSEPEQQPAIRQNDADFAIAHRRNPPGIQKRISVKETERFSAF